MTVRGGRWLGCLAALVLACAHGGVPADEVESAYAGLITTRSCARDDAACCERQAAQAAELGDSVKAARLWHDVAVACPAQRERVAAALRARAPSDLTTPLVNVSYHFDLPPSITLRPNA